MTATEYMQENEYNDVLILGRELMEILQRERFNYDIMWRLSTRQWLGLVLHRAVNITNYSECISDGVTLLDIIKDSLESELITAEIATAMGMLILAEECPNRDATKFAVLQVRPVCLPLPTTDHERRMLRKCGCTLT